MLCEHRSENIKFIPRFGRFLGTVKLYQPDSFSSVSGVLRHKFRVPTTLFSDPQNIAIFCPFGHFKGDLRPTSSLKIKFLTFDPH